MGFKDNLIKIRELRGKKPPDVIRATGIAKQQYYAYESGEYEPGPDNLDLLCSYLGVPKNYFFKEIITKNDIMQLENSTKESDADWFKRTIETLIHQNGDTIHEFRIRSKDEIENLRGDKAKLFDILAVYMNPPNNGK